MFRALVLGAVQGLTEFVPVSSSAHLVLVPFVLGWPIPSLAFDVAVHLGTALAVILYFRRELAGIIAGSVRALFGSRKELDVAHARLAGLLVVGSIPAAIAGLAARDLFEELFQRPEITAGLLLVTAALLLIGESAVRRFRERQRRDLGSIGWLDALIMGILQAASIAPGISRSGATMAAGLVRGLSRSTAARFTFLLALPAILGAAVVQIPDLPQETDVVTVVSAAAVAAVVGFIAIDFLLRFVRTRSFTPFAVYCVLAAAVGLGVWSQVS
jgi:undecaprenyl-diphosphatase